MGRMNVNLMGMDLKNPLIMASGTYGYGRDYENEYSPSILGGISSKGITLLPKEGNPGIRIWETPSGIMNSVGLQNPGLEVFLRDYFYDMKSLGTKVLVNLGGNSIEQYVEAAKILDDYDVDCIELNISCPNVKEGAAVFGLKCESAEEVVRAVRAATKHRLLVKLSPNAENISDMAKSVEASGADGISLVNTFQAMAVDIVNKRPVFENIYAGLSGPAIKPIALRMVHQCSKSVSIPIVGLGGIISAKDVIEFIMVGATAVQIGTGNFMDPKLPVKILEDLEKYLEENNTTVEEIRGII